MPGSSSTYAWNCNVLVTCYWQHSSTECPPPNDVATWLELLQFWYGFLPIFRAISRIEVWSPARPDAPEQFRRLAPWGSLYQPGDRSIKLHAHFASLAYLAHEVGHHIQEHLRIKPDADAYGRAWWAWYVRVRGNTPAGPVEQFASDWADVFTGKPEPVPGLREYFLALPTGRP